MLTNQPPGEYDGLFSAALCLCARPSRRRECEGLVLPEGLVAKILKPARVYDRAGYGVLTRWYEALTRWR